MDFSRQFLSGARAPTATRHPADQPVLLTTGQDNRQRRGRSASSSTAPSRLTSTPINGSVFMFDGHDEAQVEAARGQWKELKADNHAVTYWQQTPDVAGSARPERLARGPGGPRAMRALLFELFLLGLGIVRLSVLAGTLAGTRDRHMAGLCAGERFMASRSQARAGECTGRSLCRSDVGRARPKFAADRPCLPDRRGAGKTVLAEAADLREREGSRRHTADA